MQDETISLSSDDISEKKDTDRWTQQDTSWMLSLFGTAVGAGILFLPMNAGMGGFWPLIFMTVLVGPMTYLAHRALSRFVCSSQHHDNDITHVVEEYFGIRAGWVITLLYFMAIYPIVLIYGVGITNTINSFIEHQLALESPPRALLSGILVLAMIAVMEAGENFMLKVTQALVYPLIGILVFMSLYLIPNWKFDILSQIPTTSDFFSTVWLTLPILIFSFNHSPAISQFSVSLKKQYGDNATHKADTILRNTSIMLVIFVMFFVCSCVLSLSHAELMQAKSENLPVLSFLANINHNNHFIRYFAPIIAVIAIVSSFFGHYMGATEGLKGIIVKGLGKNSKVINEPILERCILCFMFVTIWGVSVLNPSILEMIKALGGPIIAAILYLMPMYAVYKVPALKPYRGRLSNLFVIIAGLFGMTAILFNLFH